MKRVSLGWIWSAWVVLGLSTSACGSDSKEPSASDGGMGDLDAGASAGSNSLVRSGARLQAVLHGPADGHKTFKHWRDTETAICQWTPDRLFGDHYCLPTRRFSIYYTDAACTQAVYLNTGLALTSGELIRDNNYYVGETNTYRAGPQVALPVALYLAETAGCTQVEAQQIPLAAVGVNPLTLVPLSDFVKGTLEVEDRGDERLASLVVVGEDGSRVAQSAYDLENTTGCGLGFPDAPPDCIPVAWHAYHFDFGESAQFADAACTIPVYYTPRFDDAVLATLRYGVTLERDTVSQEPSYLVHKLGAEVVSGEVYQGETACTAFDTPGPASTSVYYLFGDEVNLSQLSSLREGTGNIRTVTQANSAGHAVVATGIFLDTSKGDVQVEAFVFSDQVSRLVPTRNAATIQADAPYFADSACTIPLATDSSNPDATSYVIAWNDETRPRTIETIYEVGATFVDEAYSKLDGTGPCELGSQSPPYFRIGPELDKATWATEEEVEIAAP